MSLFGRIPLGERWQVNGHAGMYFWDGESTVAGITETDPAARDLFYGIGFGFDITEKVEINAGVERFDLDGVDPLVGTIGIRFRF